MPFHFLDFYFCSLSLSWKSSPWFSFFISSFLCFFAIYIESPPMHPISRSLAKKERPTFFISYPYYEWKFYDDIYMFHYILCHHDKEEKMVSDVFSKKKRPEIWKRNDDKKGIKKVVAHALALSEAAGNSTKKGDTYCLPCYLRVNGWKLFSCRFFMCSLFFIKIYFPFLWSIRRVLAPNAIRKVLASQNRAVFYNFSWKYRSVGSDFGWLWHITSKCEWFWEILKSE